MKRGLLLLIITLLSVSAGAQKDRLRIALNYRVAADTLVYTVDYRPGHTTQASYALQMRHLRPDSLALVQGRPKERLNFEQQEDRIKWQRPQSWRPGSLYRFYFKVALSRWKSLPYFKELTAGFVVNALNLSGQGTALPGFFYPAPLQGGHHLEMDLCLPAELNFSVPLNTEFQVGSAKRICYYLSSETLVQPADFFLVIGVFEDNDPQDLDAEFAWSEGAQEAVALARLRQKHRRFLDSLSHLSQRMLLDEDLLAWAALSESVLAGKALVQAGDLPPEDFSLADFYFKEKAALYALGQADSAALFLYRYYSSTLGADWQEEFLALKGKAPGSVSFLWSEWLRLQARKGGLEAPLPKLDQASTLSERPQQERKALTALYRAYSQTRDSLRLGLQYRYDRSAAGLQLIFDRADSLPMLSFPVDLIVITGQEALGDTQRFYPLLGKRDTLLLPLAGPPRSAYLLDQPPRPLVIAERRPLNYWLYDLAQGSKERKDAAIDHLLSAANRQLLATVIGIALRSTSPQHQEKALTSYDRLSPGDQARFLSELEQIAASGPSPALRQKAREIIRGLPSE